MLIFGTIAHLASCVSSLSFAGLILNISSLPVFCFTTLFPRILPSLFQFISPLVVQHVVFLLFRIFNFHLSVTVLPYSFSLPSCLLLPLPSHSCWRGWWRRFRTWRPQFCHRKRESVTWRTSFPSTPTALTDSLLHCLSRFKGLKLSNSVFTALFVFYHYVIQKNRKKDPNPGTMVCLW